MKYNIVVLADLHRSILEPEIQDDRSEYIFTFLDMFSLEDKIDMIVIDGDFWDSKMLLNSKSAISGIKWMNRLYDKAIEIGVTKFRIVKGTEDHDNSQLEAFRSMEDDNGFFKIFNTTISEETLPGLKCIYCPDETMCNTDYKDTYINEMLSGNQIGFFHGSFDIILPEILQTTAQSQKNVVYEYLLWEKLIDGPMVAGHWHDGKVYDNLIYVGSNDCWKFNEDEPKGFGFIQYDTDTSKYFYQKIENILSPLYLTYECYTNLCDTMESYQPFIHKIDEKLLEFDNSYRELKIRLVVYVVTDEVNNDTFISSLRHYYINEKRVKLQIKNKLKDKKKKEEVKQNKATSTKYNFVTDKDKTAAEIIQEFIMLQKNVKIPLEFIDARINKYPRVI